MVLITYILVDFGWGFYKFSNTQCDTEMTWTKLMAWAHESYSPPPKCQGGPSPSHGTTASKCPKNSMRMVREDTSNRCHGCLHVWNTIKCFQGIYTWCFFHRNFGWIRLQESEWVILHLAFLHKVQHTLVSCRCWERLLIDCQAAKNEQNRDILLCTMQPGFCACYLTSEYGRFGIGAPSAHWLLERTFSFPQVLWLPVGAVSSCRQQHQPSQTLGIRNRWMFHRGRC